MLAISELKLSKPSRSFFSDAKNAAISSRLIVTSGSIMLVPLQILAAGPDVHFHPAA
jgi:hypothetical protein